MFAPFHINVDGAVMYCVKVTIYVRVLLQLETVNMWMSGRCMFNITFEMSYYHGNDNNTGCYDNIMS